MSATQPAPVPAPMPVPRTTSTEIQVELGTEANPLVVRWTASGQRGEKRFERRHCYAVLTPDGAVLIDPSEPAEADRRRWEQLIMPGGRPPIATLLTSSWHERSCYVLRERYGIPVWLPAAGAANVEEARDARRTTSSTPRPRCPAACGPLPSPPPPGGTPSSAGRRPPARASSSPATP